jgi:hypothetical protein
MFPGLLAFDREKSMAAADVECGVIRTLHQLNHFNKGSL